MIPEFSHFSLILAGVMAFMTALLPSYLVKHDLNALRFARFGSSFQVGLLLLAYLGLTLSFYQNDFSVSYIAEHSSAELPWFYRLTAVWGSHEGSMLLWVMLFAGWIGVYLWIARKQSDPSVLPTLQILALINAGFIGFIVFTSNPFLRTLPNVPLSGADLNPLLQDPGFLIHPPILYMGYVGFGLCFAMAMTALFRKEMDRIWINHFYTVVLVAWCCLTTGIMLGSWWAYRELGWGGWWFWDPVENAAFLPWLIATALLHAVTVAKKRGQFKAWILLLAIIAFGLSLLGTFLVRSGVLTSVHAFAVDPKRGIYILLFIAAIIGSGLSLFSYRMRAFKQNEPFDWLSRESFLLANTILLLILMLTVLLGTLYPLLVDALGFGKLSVGAPYFNAVFVPLAVPLLILMGIGPLCHWRETDREQLWRLLKPALIFVSLGLCGLCVWWWQGAAIGMLFGLFLALWISVTTLRFAFYIEKFSWSSLAVVLAHLGVAISLIGISVNSYTMDERLVKLDRGGHTQLGPYAFYLETMSPITASNYHGVKAQLRVEKDGRYYTTIYPEKRLFEKSRMPMTHAGIHIAWWGDLYVALGEPVGETAWSLRVYRKPFVRFIWAGGLFMLFGGLSALINRRVTKS